MICNRILNVSLINNICVLLKECLELDGLKVVFNISLLKEFLEMRDTFSLNKYNVLSILLSVNK